MHVLQINNCAITINFGTEVAHDKPIPHAKQNSRISTDVIVNDVIILKFERFRQKALNLKRLYLSGLVGLLINSCWFYFSSQNWEIFLNVIFEPLNLSRYHGNMERSILKFDSPECVPLTNGKSHQVRRENFLFWVILEKPLGGGFHPPPPPPQ